MRVETDDSVMSQLVRNRLVKKFSNVPYFKLVFISFKNTVRVSIISNCVDMAQRNRGGDRGTVLPHSQGGGPIRGGAKGTRAGLSPQMRKLAPTNKIRIAPQIAKAESILIMPHHFKQFIV